MKRFKQFNHQSLCGVATVASLVACTFGCKMMAPHEAIVPQRQTTTATKIESTDQTYFRAQESFLPTFENATQIGMSSENAAVSPLNAYLTLGILINGSQNSTFDLCAKLIQLDDPRIERMNAANSKILDILANQPSDAVRLATGFFNVLPLRFNREFQSDMSKFYDAQITKLGSAGEGAQKVLNDWGADRMGKDFPPAVDDIDPKTETLSISLLMISASPKSSFRNVPSGRFLTSTGSIQAPLLVSENCPAALSKVGSAKICTIQLSAPDLLLSFVIPGPKLMVSTALTAEVFKTAQANQTFIDRSVSIPKFSVLQSVSMNDAFDRIGGGALMKPGNDFSIMSHDMKTSSGISLFLQRNKFDFGNAMKPANESEYQIKTWDFIADRPFAYFVWEKRTKAVLLLGVIQDPSKP